MDPKAELNEKDRQKQEKREAEQEKKEKKRKREAEKRALKYPNKAPKAHKPKEVVLPQTYCIHIRNHFQISNQNCLDPAGYPICDDCQYTLDPGYGDNSRISRWPWAKSGT
jgi:hypothetical protein